MWVILKQLDILISWFQYIFHDTSTPRMRSPHSFHWYVIQGQCPLCYTKSTNAQMSSYWINGETLDFRALCADALVQARDCTLPPQTSEFSLTLIHTHSLTLTHTHTHTVTCNRKTKSGTYKMENETGRASVAMWRFQLCHDFHLVWKLRFLCETDKSTD